MAFNDNVRHVFEIFHNNYECYLVGGAVRDITLGLIPTDYDFATNALPEEVEKLFHNTLPTGKAYGTITIRIEDDFFEITTYRKDLDYDGRRPKAISFSNKLIEDLKRRDFTMNAMAMDSKGSLIDPFNGIQHLKEKRIVFVGNPHQRILEDKLRILRALRFTSLFGFNLPQGLDYPYDITTLSKERIREEFSKIIMGNYFRFVFDNPVAKKFIYQFLPELKVCDGFQQHNANHTTLLTHLLDTMGYIERKLELRLAALFHDIGKTSVISLDKDGIGHFYGHATCSIKHTKNIMKRLHYSSAQIKVVTDAIAYHIINPRMKKIALKKMLNYGIEMDNIFKLMIADNLASNRVEAIWDVYRLIDMMHKIIYTQEPFSLKDLAVNGHDLKSLGLSGKRIGIELNRLLDVVLNNPNKNDKEYLLSIVQLGGS